MLEAAQQQEEEQRRIPVVVATAEAIGKKEEEKETTLPIVEWDEKGELRLLPGNLKEGGGVEGKRGAAAEGMSSRKEEA